MPAEAVGPAADPREGAPRIAVRALVIRPRVEMDDEAAAHGGRRGRQRDDRSRLRVARVTAGPRRPFDADHGITLPDWVVRTTTVRWAGAGTLVTIVIGLGALASMTVAPGGGVCPGVSWT